MRILDPRSLGVGAVLVRSGWFLGRLTGRARRARARRQLGVVTRIDRDAEDGLYWPLVHWEGEARATLTHPRTVRPLRRTRTARYVQVTPDGAPATIVAQDAQG